MLYGAHDIVFTCVLLQNEMRSSKRSPIYHILIILSCDEFNNKNKLQTTFVYICTNHIR